MESIARLAASAVARSDVSISSPHFHANLSGEAFRSRGRLIDFQGTAPQPRSDRHNFVMGTAVDMWVPLRTSGIADHEGNDKLVAASGVS
jgi:hypothetical protein